MLDLSREETVLYIVLASHKECVDNVKIRELFGVMITTRYILSSK